MASKKKTTTTQANGEAAPAAAASSDDAPSALPPLVLAKGQPPDVEAMRRAAEVHGVKVPAGFAPGATPELLESATRELLGLMRVKMVELNAEIEDDQQLQCHECGERSTEDTEWCPFCGDLGIAPEGEVPARAINANISNLPEVAPKRNVDVAVAQLGSKLDAALAKLVELKGSILDSSYDMGLVCKQIHDEQLFKARGFDSFKQFADSAELTISRSTAYQLMGLVEKFTRETYQELGYRKLRTIAVLESGDRDKVVAEARSNGGSSVREIDEKVRERRGAGSEKSRPAQSAPPKNPRVTLLTKLDGKPRELRFKSSKSGAPIGSAAKVSQFVGDAYAEVELDGGVFLRIGLRVSGRDLIGLSAEFRRDEELAAVAQ